MANGSSATWDDVDQAKPAALSQSVTWDDVTPKLTPAELKAKVAQPTEFEKQAYAEGASATPWTDIGKGLGEGALKTVANVGSLIHKIPSVGEALVPSQGLAAEEKLATPCTPGEKLGSNIESVAEAAIPVGEAVDAIKGSKYVAPAARFVSENVLPSIEHIPYLGPGLRAAENAPTWVKAATRGASTGAGLGAIEQGIRTRLNPIETAKGALYGGLFGGLAGAGAHAIGQVAHGIPDFENVPFAGETEPPVTRIPAVSNEPFSLTSPEAGRETAIQQPIDFPKTPEVTVEPMFRTDKNGTRWARMPGSPAEVSVPSHLSGKEADAYARDKLNLQDRFAALRGGSAINRLGQQIEQGAGWKPLEPNVPIGAQPRSLGAAASAPEQVNPRIPVIGHPLGNQSASDVSEALGPAMTAPKAKSPTIVTEEPARQMGAPPLRPGVSLREQPRTAEAPVRTKEQDLRKSIPDDGQRQMAHIDGEQDVDAIGDEIPN